MGRSEYVYTATCLSLKMEMLKVEGDWQCWSCSLGLDRREHKRNEKRNGAENMEIWGMEK